MAKLRNISERLAKAENINVTDLFAIASEDRPKSKKEKELENLVDLAKSDPKIVQLLKNHSKDETIFRKLYNKLVQNGAGRFARGYWVAGASLVFPNTLEALLRNFDGENFVIQGYSTQNAGSKVAYRMFAYFADGENGPIEEI